MRLLRLLVAAAIALLLDPSVARAGQATCSNPGVPVGASASSDLLPGRLTLGLTTSLLPIHDEETLGLVDYEASVTLVETRLSAELAVRSWLGVGVSLPYRVAGVGVTYRDADSGEVIAPEPTTHARDEVLHGVGDPALLAHLAREVGAFRLHARFGTSIPIGHTEEDPVALGAMGFEHQHLQFGTGTFVPFAAVEVQRPVGDVTLAAWALTHASLYESPKGYRAGDRFSGGLTGSSELGARDWTFSLAIEAHGETAEEWHGAVPENEGNEGRLDLLAGVGVAWRPRPDLAIAADLKIPVYSHAIGSQLDYPLVFGLGVTGSFDVSDAPSWDGLDHDTLEPAGTAAALDPVIGRITVFDLHADWCAPCRQLDADLVALARRYPDRLAIRQLDVVDNESEAWMRYLEPGGFDLPHIKVHAADGSFLFERSGPPAELVEAVEALLR